MSDRHSKPQDDWLEEAVRRGGEALFAEHPAAEDLVLLNESPTELGSEQVASVLEHLRVCDQCADDLARLRAADLELQREVGGKENPVGLGELLRRYLAPRFLVPVASLAVVALVLLSPPDRTGPTLPVGPPQILRQEVERGGKPVVRADAAGFITLSFVLPDDGNGPLRDCSVTVELDGGRTALSLDRVPAFDDYGTFLLTTPAERLPAGSYRLLARDRLGETVFPFVVEP